jgi:hypothetical protein
MKLSEVVETNVLEYLEKQKDGSAAKFSIRENKKGVKLTTTNLALL